MNDIISILSALPCRLLLLFSIFAMNPTSANQAATQGSNDPPADLLTVAEKSGFEATCLSAEVVDFIDACDKKANHVRKFVWGQTVEGRPMVGAIVATKPYELGQQDDRNVVLLMGNIHSGECCGKEALLMMLRELTLNPAHPWLQQNVILIAPNYNADGNDRIGKNNRPGQAGPIQGMGRRENAQQLDLNRDFIKLESPEARALVKLIDQANPHMFVDCHTTDGSEHQYHLTYDIPHNPATAEPIRDYLRNKMMPQVTEALDQVGTPTFYYGNFNRDNTSWTTYGHEPRYSTEYVGLRGRLGILSEAYSYLDYKGRIMATRNFCSALMDYVTEHHAEVHQLLETVDSDLIKTAAQQPERVSVSLSAKAVAFPEKFTIKGYDGDEPVDFECDFIGKYESTRAVPLPWAYLIPSDQARVVDRLLMHGIDVEVLTEAKQLAAQLDTIAAINRNDRAFQKHRMVQLETDRELGNQNVPAGTYVVKTAQPLGRLVAYLLEPESDDGLAFWNFFDDVLEVGKRYPVSSLPNPVELETREVKEVSKVEKINLEMLDGPDRLLASQPAAPSWLGDTNIIKTRIYNRDMLLDAKSASFVNRPARPYRPSNVAAALVDAGMEQELADAISQADPRIPTSNEVVVLSAKKHSVVYYTADDPTTRDAIAVLGTPENPAELFRFSDDEQRLAFVNDQGLNFFNLQTRSVGTIERESDQHLIGKLDWVYQEELYGRGNFKGFWWQSGGQQIAFLRLDETPLIPFTVMDHLPVHGKSEMTNYPKAGDPNPDVAVGVVDCNDPASVQWVDLSQYGDEEILVSGVTWSSDGYQLMLQVQNREQTWLDLVSTDPEGKNVRVLFRDQTPAWIESPGDPVLLDDGEFIWRSPRSGYSHLYRYDRDGKLRGEITSGQWEVRSLLGVDPDKQYCYFTATKDSPIETHVYRVHLSEGSIERLTEPGMSHAASFNHDFSMFIDSASSVSQPTEYALRDNSGQLIRRLSVPSDDRLKYLNISQPEFLTVDSGNEQPLDAMLIKPPDFDPSKKYPVLVHIYAGPQAPRVQNSFGGANYLWHQMLAQQGYVIWLCDNQSASYRSVKNAWPIHRNMAVNELADIERGVDWLRNQPWVDGDRIGIWGWSYGGYMTAFALTHSQSFKVGISGAPVTDWKNYDSIYTERYMGRPQTNESGYKSSSVLNDAAKDLHGKLLLIHGTIDDNVHLNNTLQFVKQLQYAGKQFELMMYPSNRHSVRDPLQSAHLRRLMTEFVQENL